MELGEGLKKILLVGIGTAAVTAEKSKEILDELVKKGELTVEQGKVKAQIESMQAEAAKEKEEASEAAEEPVEEAAPEAPVEEETVTEEAGSEEPAAE